MLGASCTLAHHEAHPEHVQSLSLAKHMLAKAREADAALAQLPKTGSMTEQAAASHDKGFRENMLMLVSVPAVHRLPATPALSQMIDYLAVYDDGCLRRQHRYINMHAWTEKGMCVWHFPTTATLGQ